MVIRSNYPLSEIGLRVGQRLVGDMVDEEKLTGAKAIRIALAAFSKYLNYPDFAIPLIDLTVSCSRFILPVKKTEPVLKIEEIYKKEAASNRIFWKEPSHVMLTSSLKVFDRIANSLQSEVKSDEKKAKLKYLKNSFEQMKLSTLFEIGSSLNRYENKMSLLLFLSRREIKGFTDPRLQQLLISSFSNYCSTASLIKDDLFWRLTKRVVYSFSPNPVALNALIEGGVIDGIALPSLFQVHSQEDLLALFSELLPLFETFAPYESRKIIENALQKVAPKNEDLSLFFFAPIPSPPFILSESIESLERSMQETFSANLQSPLFSISSYPNSGELVCSEPSPSPPILSLEPE